MKSFMKWPHIDNLYQFDRDQLLADYGDTEFAVTEKLDGCNVCLSCDFSQPNVRAFSRNGEDWTNSKDLQPALNRVMPFVEFVRSRYENQHDPVYAGFYLYGELVNTKDQSQQKAAKRYRLLQLNITLFVYSGWWNFLTSKAIMV